MDLRAAKDPDVDRVARVWHEGWHDAHAAIVPAELTLVRTLESFRQRMSSVRQRCRDTNVRASSRADRRVPFPAWWRSPW